MMLVNLVDELHYEENYILHVLQWLLDNIRYIKTVKESTKRRKQNSNYMDNSEINERLITEFVTMSAEYCRALNSLDQFTPHGFATFSLQLLPMLYVRAFSLPSFDDYDREAVENLSQEEWTRVKLQLSKLFGKNDKYAEQFTRFGDEATESLSENLADVYQDLKDFTQLIAFGIDDAIVEAVGEVKHNFEDYWDSDC